MKPAVTLLGLVLLMDVTFAVEESCVGRCGSFDPLKKCQCDSMCVYYGSCCADFDSICPKKIARGDTFDGGEDIETTTTFPTTVAPTYPTYTTTNTTEEPVDPDAASCSGRPFDAFLQLKNGSIYAFRGQYFFELDDKSVLPGYPKLIEDVWGIPGPIDAAFTRLNCQGKSYIFKGSQYWRFDGDVLDDDFPRMISVGFSNIPNNVDAAFAIPAASHRSKEKVYFFKGDKYYQYEFKQQPSHEECVEITRSSPSVLFTKYTDIYCDQTLEDLFAELFGSSSSSQTPTGPRSISRDWHGIRPPVNAVMVGRVHLSPKTTQPPPPRPPPSRRRGGRRRRPSRRRGHGRRQTRFALFEDFWGYDYDWLNDDYSEYTDPEVYDIPTTERKTTPVQNVYFFKGANYFRANLQKKRVDSVNPPYPRSIAKYWLGCKDEDIPDASGAEKK